MKISVFGLLLICIVSVRPAWSQGEVDDQNYYKNWIGNWYRVSDDNDSSELCFVVTRGLYEHAFEETWMGAGGDFSKAWRAWDSRTKQWGFAWVSTEGLFQAWEGKKIHGIWYMYKTFIIGGKEVLSRQSFVLQGERSLLRTSEHSRDGGKTWVLRFKEQYVKK